MCHWKLPWQDSWLFDENWESFISRFFMRYWRQWLLLGDYTLGNNFISLNAYMCIELNAHALITFLLTVRDSLSPNSKCFMHWKLGSQSCEKIFGPARSMSSIFSTVINFGILKLLRPLHWLHIQVCQEAECNQTGIRYPRVEAHKKKDRHHQAKVCHVDSVTDQDIAEAVRCAREAAQQIVADLGMVELLWEHKY